MFSRPLWLALSLSAFSVSVQADELAPRAGEITLEGAISALNSQTQTLTIQASKFTSSTKQSRAISPPKSKTIPLKSARFMDSNGAALAFSQLKVGETVSVTGREVGAGKSFAARVLKVVASSTKPVATSTASSTKPATTQTVSSTKPIAPEVDEGYALPAVAPLLPRSVSVDGLNLRVVDAGWSSPAQIQPNSNYYSGDQDFRFGLAYRAFVPRALRPEVASTVRFNGLFAPDGTFLPYNWSSGDYSYAGAPSPSAHLLFAGVNPAWKSVRGEWEMMSGAAKPGASGQFFSNHQLEIPIPAKGEKTIETQPNLSFTTARGTKITLKTLKRASSNVELEWEYQGAAGAEDVIVELLQMQVSSSIKPTAYSYLQAQNSQTRWNQRSLVVYSYGMNDEAQTLTYKFKVSEISRAWREKDAFQRVSVEIPVASLVEKAPLEPRQSLYAPSETQKADGVEVTWESLNSGNDSLQGNVWMRDLTADAKPDTFWLVRAAKSIFTDQIQRGEGDTKERFIYSLERRNENFFHVDNSPKTPNESSTRLHIDVARGDKRAEKIDLQLTLDRATLQRKTHRFQNIPLPKPGETRTFDPDEFSDELTSVRRAAWVNDVATLPEAANRFSNWKGAALFVTLDITRLYPDGEWDFNELQFFDDKGLVNIARQQNFQRTDPLGELPDAPSQFTLMLPAPYTGAPSFDLMFTVSERKWLEQPREVRLKDIVVPVAPSNS